MTVFDASALLALARQEPGATIVAQKLSSGHVSAVNVSEFVQKIRQYRNDGAKAFEALERLGLTFHPVNRADAYEAAQLYKMGKPYGLSLADRTCLALARQLGAEVLTADKVWLTVAKELKLEIKLIR